jgi:para-aminobenzoate synthetase/4-amino-4-deoxychorismate lyase
MHEWVLLEDRKSSGHALPGLFFTSPMDEVVCWDGNLLSSCLYRLDELKHQGYYLVGFISYEAGYYFQSLMQGMASEPSSLPLLHFYAFKTFSRLSAQDIAVKLDVMAHTSSFEVSNLYFNMTKEAYEHAFNRVKHYIREGHTYQVNLTSKYLFQFDGSPVRLYQRLRERQRVSYSGLLMFPHYQLLTLSPELFFSKTGNMMRVKPMKGTVARAQDPSLDEQQKEWLRHDPKSMAENTMIVDLLRNDLSIFSKPGSVRATQLLQVESYETVHQMVSCIESHVKEELSFYDVIRHLFPCGSITGAPKRRTMEIIRDVELAPRRLYTGTIGYIMPNNDMCFSVGIRSLLLQNQQGELGVGGGIVFDSDVWAEFEEMQLKGRFFTEGLMNT